MALSVIGAGFGRTGTESMKMALEILGLGPCHHMKELTANPAQLAQSGSLNIEKHPCHPASDRRSTVDTAAGPHSRAAAPR